MQSQYLSKHLSLADDRSYSQKAGARTRTGPRRESALSGVCAAIQLKRKLGHTNFIIFEKAHDVGEVWLTNKYPGCQVETPSLIYSYSFAQNPGWSQPYADRDELWAYIRNTASKYDIYRHAQFGTAVESLAWNEDSKTWSVTTRGIKTNKQLVHEFNIVILCTGPFNMPNYPPEFESSGPKMHSAEWKDNIKLENQIIALCMQACNHPFKPKKQKKEEQRIRIVIS